MINPGELQHPTTALKSEHDTILRVTAVLDGLVARFFGGKKREELVRIADVLEQQWST